MFAVPLIAIALAICSRERASALAAPIAAATNCQHCNWRSDSYMQARRRVMLCFGLQSKCGFFVQPSKSHCCAIAAQSPTAVHLHLCILKPAPPAKPAQRHGMRTPSQGGRTTARKQKNGEQHETAKIPVPKDRTCSGSPPGRAHSSRSAKELRTLPGAGSRRSAERRPDRR